MAGITKTAKVVKGEDVSIVFGPIRTAAGATIDFTGASDVTYRITTAQGGGSVVLTKAIGSGVSTPDTSFTVSITDTDTDAMTAGRLWHECKATVGSVTYQVLDPSPFIVVASAT